MYYASEGSDSDLLDDEGETKKNKVSLGASLILTTSEKNKALTHINEIAWMRKDASRKDHSRTDVYYKIKDTNIRFRSHNDAEALY